MPVIYKTRTNGATVTIKVPFDCQNHCPFCINKREYSDMSKFSITKIIENIKLMDSITPKCDFVFTGGEPMANLDELEKMLDAIPETHSVYVNTTLPLKTHYRGKDLDGKDTIDAYIRFMFEHGKIKCLNISRHIDQKFDGPVVSDEDIRNIENRGCTTFRINCVLYKEKQTPEQIASAVERWTKYRCAIQFRKDYMTTTMDNLYEEDRIQKILDSLYEFDHATGCRMRCGYFYTTRSGKIVSYHKTLPYSIIKEPCGLFIYNILYDIIINQDGSLDADWDGTPLDLEAYKKVTYENEPSKLAVMKPIGKNGKKLLYYKLTDKIEAKEAIDGFIKAHLSEIGDPSITMKVDDRHIIDEFRYGNFLLYVHYADKEGIFRICVYSIDENPKPWITSWKEDHPEIS